MEIAGSPSSSNTINVLPMTSQQQPPPRNARSKSSLGQISHHTTASLSMYDEVIKPFTPKVRPTTKNPEKYERFLNGFKNTHGVRAKRLHKHSLILSIEQIYAARFEGEKEKFKSIISKGGSGTDSQPFSEFVTNYLATKWKSPRLSSQVSIGFF